uniref:Uncharacterized protein n=1 Tax=Mycena chlorophos TaxID=658473 RepID=A0ABQ0LB46_MYCCL|nr:predicted protein [Mycena chlorophos]
MPTSSSLLRYDPAATPKRNITLDDYDSLPNSSYRDRIEEVVFRAMNSEHVEALLAPKGTIWPMDIFCAARDVINEDPDISENSLYFSAVSAVLCRALTALRSRSSVPLTPPSPSPSPPMDPSPAERRAMRQRIVAAVHGPPLVGTSSYLTPLRVQVLRHQHLKCAMIARQRSIGLVARAPGPYGNDSDSSEDDLEWDAVEIDDVEIVVVTRRG